MKSKEDKLQRLLTFFDLEKINKAEEQLFDQLSTYLESEFDSLPLYVLSFPIQSKNECKYTRLHWNHHNFKTKYDIKLDKVLDKFDSSKMITGELTRFSYDDENKGRVNVFLPIGAKDKQFLVAGFSLKNREFLENTSLFSLFNYHIKTSFRYLEAIRREGRLSSLANTDDVTGLFNQRKLNDDLVQIIKDSKERNQEFSLIFIDLDHFKDVNDNYGHRIGSLLLTQMAKIFRKALRDTDLIYRYGGDEFIIIIPNSGIVDELSLKIGQRLLKCIKSSDFKPEKNLSLKLSASIGVADFPKHAQTKEQIIEMADKMMYHAKEEGRGVVCHANQLLAKCESA